MCLVQVRIKRTWFLPRRSKSKIYKSINGKIRERTVAAQHVDVQTPDEMSLRGLLDPNNMAD